MRRLRFRIRLLVLAGLCCLLGPAQAYLVCVVSSEKTPAFQEATDSLTQELVRNGIAQQDVRAASITEYLEGNPGIQDARLIISLGTDAFRQVTGRNNKAAVIAALIPRISFERVLTETNKKPQTNVSALYLDQPFGRQLDLLRLTLPALRRVGVVWGPESISQQPLLSAALQARGLESSEGVLTEGQTIIGALRAALVDADALLAVADGNVFNASSISNILLSSYRVNTPVLAFSPAYVKAGALMSVHSTAAQAGQQAASMASHFLQTNSLPASQYPADYTITVNAYVARSLGLALDAKVLTERLRKLEKKP